eukprot:15431950-Alexandrium_andersonii.AAC.1
MLQADKIAADDADEQYVLCAKDVFHHLANLERTLREKAMFRAKERKRVATVCLAGNVQEFHRVALVEDVWRPQYAYISRRSKFL